jgi:hypothetical protein
MIRCAATTLAGQPCRRWVVKAGDLCPYHRDTLPYPGPPPSRFTWSCVGTTSNGRRCRRLVRAEGSLCVFHINRGDLRPSDRLVQVAQQVVLGPPTSDALGGTINIVEGVMQQAALQGDREITLRAADVLARLLKTQRDLDRRTGSSTLLERVLASMDDDDDLFPPALTAPRPTDEG